jgi:hypothetical protein
MRVTNAGTVMFSEIRPPRDCTGVGLPTPHPTATTFNPSDSRSGKLNLARARSNLAADNYCPTKVPPHPPPPSLIWSLTIWAVWVEGKASLASTGTLLVALVSFKVISVTLPERRHTDTFPVSQGAPALLAEYTRPFAPSLIEIINGFPSFAVASCHLAFTLFALMSLTVRRHSACASLDPLNTNKQTSNLQFVRAMFQLRGAMRNRPEENSGLSAVSWTLDLGPSAKV